MSNRRKAQVDRHIEVFDHVAKRGAKARIPALSKVYAEMRRTTEQTQIVAGITLSPLTVGTSSPLELCLLGAFHVSIL
jgi:hypothetical protein